VVLEVNGEEVSEAMCRRVSTRTRTRTVEVVARNGSFSKAPTAPPTEVQRRYDEVDRWKMLESLHRADRFRER